MVTQDLVQVDKPKSLEGLGGNWTGECFGSLPISPRFQVVLVSKFNIQNFKSMLDVVHYAVSTNVINDFEWEADKVHQAGEQCIYTTNQILPKHAFWPETKIYEFFLGRHSKTVMIWKSFLQNLMV